MFAFKIGLLQKQRSRILYDPDPSSHQCRRQWPIEAGWPAQATVGGVRGEDFHFRVATTGHENEIGLLKLKTNKHFCLGVNESLRRQTFLLRLEAVL